MNVKIFFIFVADNVFKATCIACVSAVNMELIFHSDAESVRCPVVSAAPLPISL